MAAKMLGVTTLVKVKLAAASGSLPRFSYLSWNAGGSHPAKYHGILERLR